MILIDFNGIAISNVVTEKVGPDENLIRHIILNTIRLYRKKFYKDYGDLVICTDGFKNWRKDAYPQYKYKRRESRKESKIDWGEYFKIINIVLEEIKENFPYKVIEVPEVEADDIIGTLCEETQKFGRNEPVLIISKDKDFAQLQRYSNVHQFTPQTKSFIKEDNPRKALMEFILKGDSSDGIPNVLNDDNVFVDGIRQKPLRKPVIDKLMDDPKSMGEEVYRNFLRNKKLIDLTETPETLKEKIIYNYENQDKEDNKRKVYTYLIQKRCRLLIEDVKDFV